MEAKFEQNRKQARWDAEQQELKQEKAVQQRLNEKDSKVNWGKLDTELVRSRP